MSWTDANIARRQNITNLTGNISRTAGDIAALREARKNRQQQTWGNLSKILMEMSGRKFQSEEASKERDWRTGERTGAQEYGTGEREAAQKYGTGEREAEQGYKTGERIGSQDYASGEAEKERALTREEWPWRTKWAAAGRAEQNVYAGGDDKLAAFDKGFNAWIDKTGAQNPDWFIKDEYGEVLGYNIPDEGWAQFKSYMETLYPNISGAEVDAYIDSIRALTEESELPEEQPVETQIPFNKYINTEDDKVNDIIRNKDKIKVYEGMSQGEGLLVQQFRQYLQGGLTSEERASIAELYPSLMEIINKYYVSPSEQAQQGTRTPGRGRGNR